MKRTQKLIGLFFALVLVLGLSITAMAAESLYGVRAESVVAGDLTCTVDSDGVLTWTALPGATSYDLNIYMKGGLVKSETGLTSTSYELEAMLDGYKKDSGTVEVHINVWGGTGRGGRANFLYSSPYPKLEAPTNLRWDVNGNPDWDDVANADGYTLYLYQPSGGAFNHYDLGNTSYFACTNYPEVATRVSDGWYFTVRATSTEGYRPSEYNESYHKGNIPGSGLRAETVVGRKQKITFTVSDRGVLTWSKVPGATSYDLNIWTKDGLFKAENGQTLGGYSLQEELNDYKKDSGAIEVTVLPKGNNAYDYADAAYFLYSSPYGKLEAPANLYWNGNMAGWSAVEGAESYTVYLYQPSGSGYNHWTTTEPYFDFSSVATIGEDWFFAVKATASNARDSAYNESPRYTAPASTTLYTIGAYAYDGTNGVMDSGGQVYLETNAGVVDWTSAGDTCLAVEGTAVTVKAAPTPGYVFVEWRQGTEGATISREAEYSFTATGDKFLYAIFRDKGDYEIAEVVGKIAAENIPRAGMEVEDFMPDIPDDEPYSRTWNGSEWRDENGVLISANIGHHYDRGYEFEAGRTYTTDYFYFDANSGYTFAEDATVHLMGPERSMWDYEVTGFNDAHTVMYVRFTFRIPGDRTYPDINKVSLVYYGTTKDGAAQPDPAKLIYNNCAITREEWNSGTWGTSCTWDTSTGENKFVSGNTYVHMIELTALPGYHFSEDLLAQKGMQGEEEYGVVSLSADRTVATVTYTYNVDDLEAINTVTLDTKAGNEDFYLIRGGDNLTSGLPFTTFYTQQNAPYDIRFENYYEWYDVETEKEVDSITAIDLEVGKKYRLEFDLVLKDEYVTTHRFAESPTLVLNDYQQAHASFVDIETDAWGSGEYLRVNITYTVQPKPGEGSGQHYPLVCYTYDEFKYAMENDDIRYVALGDVDDMMPLVRMNQTGPYNDNRWPSIWVNSTKTLTLLGTAEFTAPMAQEGVHRVYDSLIQVRPNGKLNIKGSGSLTFHGNAVGWPTAVVAVEEDGVLSIESGTVRGDTGNRTSFCYAVNVNGGTLYVYDGTLIGTNCYDQSPISAVNLYDGVAYIHGGTFQSRVFDGAVGSKYYGLSISEGAAAHISGGVFKGISLPPSTQSHTYRMSDYVESGYVMTIDGVKSTPSIYHTISGSTVEVYKEISKIDIHVNSPAAGEVPATTLAEVYLVPDGCTVKSIQWYENGELWSDIDFGSARFEAGNTYKVEIALVTDAGVKFANPLSSATINGKEATVTALEDDRETGIVMTANLGKCANSIDLVELSVYAPKEGNTVSFSIGDNSSAYQTMGAANSASEYREWIVSDTGAAGTYQLMKEGDKFVSGKYYKIVVWVQTANHYEFPVHDDNGRIMPNVSATVNGYYATVRKAYEQDPSRVIEVEYDFGVCNDDTVEQIAVVDVTAPVAGERPNYTYNILGSGYQMNTAKNAYYDDWMHDQKLYYIKNGIGWWDVTEEDWVYEHETFIPGHEYKVYVYLVTEDGYEFAYTAKSYENAVTATVNGKAADVQIWDGYWASQRRVGYTFTCEKKDVSTVMIYLDAPQAGKTPADYTGTTAYPELYQISEYYNGVQYLYWYDADGMMLDSDQEFVRGERYTAEIKVVPTQNNGMDMCRFNNVTAYVNGKKVEARVGALNDGVTASSTAAYITYTFTDGGGASAPEIEIYAFTSQPKGGTVIVDEWHNAAWETTFIPTMTEIQIWDGAAWDQFDIQYPETAEEDYDFGGLDAGTYRFRIVAYVGGDAMAISNEFTITWEEVHTHQHSQTWSKDETGHWHECACGDKADFAGHISSGAATESQAEVCTFCGWEISPQLNHTHKFETGWTKNDTNHWHASTCGHDVTSGMEPHHGGIATCKAQAVCEVCGQSYGAKNLNNHTETLQWVQTPTTHKQAYTCCGTVVITETNHNWGANKVCTECHYGCIHTYGDPVFAWQPDFSAAKASQTCGNCGGTKTVTCVIESLWNGESGTLTFTATAEGGFTDAQTMQMAVAGGKLTITNSAAEENEAVDMLIMVAGYTGGQMTGCQVIQDVTGVTEIDLTVFGERKVFFLRPGTYAPLFVCAEL